MGRTDADFGSAVRALLKDRGLSLRAAQVKTGIDHSTIQKMTRGMVPHKGLLLDFAVGMGESVNKWLVMGGYEPIPEAGGVGDHDKHPDACCKSHPPRVGLRHPDPPPEVLDAIDEAVTRAEKVALAIDYMKRPELRLRFGADEAPSIEAQIAIIRAYERLAGIRLLPLEVT